MSHPLLLEINTRCWLRDLSDQARARITLEHIPEGQFDRWRRMGFTHIWLMGVWTTGPQSRACALQLGDLRDLCIRSFGHWNENDIPGSPYAIGGYAVPETLGGESGLQRFRQRLHESGLKLVLDFIPNHTGLDHPWLESHPEWFVSKSTEFPGAFAKNTRAGLRWIAHGRDPWFPPWTDTAQIDFRNLEARYAVLSDLQSVATRCDGVRCDMAMLVLNDVFSKTWSPIPGRTPNTEFWPDAIKAVKQRYPNFMFLAEVYWDLELRLQEMGFDYTYDKTYYDLVVRREVEQLQGHLVRYASNAQMARFLENHDEPPIASLMAAPELKQCVRNLLEQRCMRLFHEPQLLGKKKKTPVQLARCIPEPADPELERIYAEALGAS